MENLLRLLIVEDSESDAELIVRLLDRAGFILVHQRVQSEEEMKGALENSRWDIIIADFSMPRFDALSALRLCHEYCPDTPFLVVSGSIGEDTAVAMMKAGAHDYVMKDNLARLIPAVKRELGDAEVRRKNRLAEEALRESEERYRALYEDNPTMYFTTDANGTVLSVNRFGAEELGYGVEELVGKPVIDILCPEDREPTRRHFSLCLQNPMQVVRWESRKVRKDGTVLWFKEAARSVRRPDGHAVVLVVSEDITERKRTEEERVRLAAAIEQCVEAIFIMSTSWIIHYVNPAFENISGYSRHEIIGRHTSSILRSDNDGSTFYNELAKIMDSGDVWSGRLTNRRKDGKIYEAEVTVSPVRDKDGTIISYVTIHRDITREVRLEKQLRHAQKMEAIGTLAGGISHDFNNILTAIMGFAQMARYKIPGASPAIHDLDRVIEAGARATDLVRQILTFSRRTEQEQRPVETAGILKEALSLLRSSLPSTVEINCEIVIPPEESTVLADPTQIHQVLMNLCTNAAHAMRNTGGVLTIRLSSTVADSSLIYINPDLNAGPYVCLSVTDTGHGMRPEVLERIFDPYFTTKLPGEGTGLGLAVVDGIVKASNGAISVFSRLDEGTTFHVFLPQVGGDTQIETETLSPIPAGGERILFVDDESLLVELGTEMLETLGYHVTSRSSSLEALELFRAQPEAFDLVITDMTMPGLTGKDLARQLMEIRADIPVILCTGFSEQINEKKSKEAGIREFVMKPYVVKHLATAIRRVLGENIG